MLTTNTNTQTEISSQQISNALLPDGSKGAELFHACNVNPEDIGEFIAIVNEMTDEQYPAFYYLSKVLDYSIEDAKDALNDVTLYHGSLKNAAIAEFNRLYLDRIPYEVHDFIDYDGFVMHREWSGSMAEFEFAGETYTVCNADEL